MANRLTVVKRSARDSRAPSIRRALEEPNRHAERRLRADRPGEASRRARKESMLVNAEFADVEREPDAQPPRHLTGRPQRSTTRVTGRDRLREDTDLLVDQLPCARYSLDRTTRSDGLNPT
jgi:hypothetical protein